MGYKKVLSNSVASSVQNYYMHCVDFQSVYSNNLTINVWHFLGMEAAGIHHLVKESIAACDINIRQDLYLNIILSGASTMFRSMHELIKKA